MVHWHNRVLASHQKGRNNAICNNIDQPGDCQIIIVKWSKSDNDKYNVISLIHGIFFKKLYKWTYLQNRNKDLERMNLWLPGEKFEGQRDRLGVIA